MATISDTVGDTVIVAYEFESIPVGATFAMQWRVTPSAADTVVDLTGVVDGTTVTFTLSAAASAVLDAGVRWYYDAERTVDGVVDTFDSGRVILDQDVTR